MCITNDSSGVMSSNFRRGLADQIHEFTMDYMGVWHRTLVMVLYDSTMLNFSGSRSATVNELYMDKGRNDGYKRLYITDSWGNMWECSVPPRDVCPRNVNPSGVTWSGGAIPRVFPSIIGD